MLIRIILNRPLSIALGIVFLAPAIWLWLGNYRWETPITDGLGLVLGATGTALVIAGVGGRKPDWIDKGN